MGKNTVVHILRAQLPWRASRLTECGMLAAFVHSAKPTEEVVELYHEDKTLVCATCVQFQRSGFSIHQESPLEREVAWSRRNRRRKDHFIDWELKAIGELVARHQEEFARLVAALQAENTIQKGLG
jgi:hypothetical protein